MNKKTVPIQYGLVSRGVGYFEARYEASTNTFPNAKTSIEGGCCVEQAEWAIIYSCPDCERAQAKWMTEIGNAMWQQLTNRSRTPTK